MDHQANPDHQGMLVNPEWQKPRSAPLTSHASNAPPDHLAPRDLLDQQDPQDLTVSQDQPEETMAWEDLPGLLVHREHEENLDLSDLPDLPDHQANQVIRAKERRAPTDQQALQAHRASQDQSANQAQTVNQVQPEKPVLLVREDLQDLTASQDCLEEKANQAWTQCIALALLARTVTSSPA